MKLITITSWIGLFGFMFLCTYYFWPWTSTDVIGKALTFIGGWILLAIGCAGIAVAKAVDSD